MSKRSPAGSAIASTVDGEESKSVEGSCLVIDRCRAFFSGCREGTEDLAFAFAFEERAIS